MDKAVIQTALNKVYADLDALKLLLLEEPETARQIDAAEAREICFGAKVDLGFKAGVLWIEDQIKLEADYLMPCMAFETGGTFSPSIRNAAGSSGTGLIQFMEATAKKLGTTTADLAKMTGLQQLSYVYKYFRAFGTNLSGWGLEDVYMAILYPKAIGQPLSWTFPWPYGQLAYKQNAGLDKNKDRLITKAEAAAGVQRLYALGMSDELRG